ncbi:MAG: hypothetical protein JSU06_14315 [Actinobacteria bacterium]|nr:hypothetical protein [Actinomycetota bacterium]
MKRRGPAADPLATMREANPVDAAALRAELGEEETGRAMTRSIDAAAVPRDPVPAGDAFAAGLEPRSRPRRLRSVALAAALTVLIAAALLASGAFSGGGAHPTYAAAAIEVAEANPRLLVTAPGWRVTDAGEFERASGETTFGDGRRTFSLNWYPARLYRSYLRDRAQVSPPQHSRLLGRTATTVDYGRGEYATMIAPIGAVFVEVRGRLGGHAAYEQVLHSLRAVEVDTWLAAMPASVVSPGARPQTVAAMLRGIPYPPRFDPSRIENETAVLNHYQLGVRVADAVACGWVESWLAAQASGDAVAARAAVDAMASSHHWPLLLRMEREVKMGWSTNIWHAAAELRRGHLDQGFGEALVRPDGSGYKIGPAWATELQCTARIRRVPFAAGEAPGAGR